VSGLLCGVVQVEFISFTPGWQRHGKWTDMPKIKIVHPPPPELPLDRLRVAAKIDYVTVSLPDARQVPDGLGGAGIWTSVPGNRHQRRLTVHDATRKQVLTVIEKLNDPVVMKLEIAVDFIPRDVSDLGSHDQLLDQTYQAVAARFRPEDAAMWAYGKRGAVSGAGMPVEPLEQRRARTGQQVVYGHRNEFMQAKLYLKTRDQHFELPWEQRVVRMELTLNRWACMDESIAIGTLSSLLDFKYRAVFTKHFRIIKEPRIRLVRGLTPAERRRRENKMHRAWSLAGVAKFAIPSDLPLDTLPLSIREIKRRRKVQLRHDQFRLMRDQDANGKIGVALTNLERRMRAP
jgi:hypothetical protein